MFVFNYLIRKGDIMKKAMAIALLIFVIIGGVILTKASKDVVKKMEVNPHAQILEKLKF